jgi:hypothetical protein
MDPQMVSEIQSYNMQGPAMIEEYLKVVSRLGKAMIQGNVEMLRNSMAESAQRFGEEFLEQMMKASHEIESRLRELEKASRRRMQPEGREPDQASRSESL